MFRLLKILVVLIFTSVFSSGALSQSYVEGEVIVKLKSSYKSPATQKFFGKAQGQNKLVLKNSFSNINMYHFSGKLGKSVESMIADLQSDPNVEYAEPNYILTKKDLNGFEQTYSSEEISAMAQNQSYLATNADIHVQEVWQSVGVKETKPIVAVIDTGLDINHPVFVGSGAIWNNPGEIANNGIDDDSNGYIDDVNGWNFVHNSGYMFDDDGHGTHVSGIVLSVGQDIFTNPISESKIKIMPLKFLDSSGVGTTSSAISAIYYAIQNGAQVLNNSWGGPNYSGALHEALVYSYEQGVTFVAAAGNAAADNDFYPMYPASYNVPHVISVAATTDLDSLATFSNFGKSSVGLGSPGVFILSTIPNAKYGSSSGTSMAAPFVSGVAALMIAENEQLLGYHVKEIVFNHSDPVDLLKSKIVTESRINAYSAIEYSKVVGSLAGQPSYSFTNEDRQLASSIAGGGGCGMVGKLYSDMTKNERGGWPPGAGGGINTWYIVIILGLLAFPLMMLQFLRSQLPENRRRHQRFEIDSSVKVRVGGKELMGSVSSISMGGVQLNTNELLDRGSIIKMTITSPDGQDQVEANGHIVWSESQKAYGVQFDETTKTLREKISIWTKSLKPT